MNFKNILNNSNKNAVNQNNQQVSVLYFVKIEYYFINQKMFIYLLQTNLNSIIITMNRTKRVDFSNIYSPKNNFIASPLAKYNKSPLSKTPNSKINYGNQPTITDIKKIDQYKKIEKVRLNKQIMDKISYTLEIQETSHRQYQLREKNQNLYLNYTVNPFIKLFDRKINIFDSQNNEGSNIQNQMNYVNKLKKAKQRKTIVEGLIEIKQKSSFDALLNRAQKSKSNAKSIINELEKSKNLAKYFQRNKKNQPSRLRDSPIKQTAKTSRSQISILDDLVAIKQESFFQKKLQNQSINIFKINFDKEFGQNYSGKQILKQFYFNNDSMVNKTQGKGICDILADISHIGRILLTEPHSQSIPKDIKLSQFDLVLNIQKINYQEMIMLIKGIISVQVLQKYLGQEQKIVKNGREEDSLIEEDKQILYNNNQRHTQTNYSYNQIDKTETKYYEALPRTKIQLHQQEISDKKTQQLNRVLELEAKCISNGILDSKIHSKLKKKKDNILAEQLQSNVDMRNCLSGKDIERKIRMNKNNKNRTESIKINTLTSSFISKLETQTKFKRKRQFQKEGYNQTWR